MSAAESATSVKGTLAGQAAESAASAGAAKTDSVLGTVDALSRSDAVFSWSGYIQALGVLFLIVAALFLALWFLRRKGGLKMLTGQGDLYLESRLALGPKKYLFVVRFLNKRLLLGVTDQQITMLTELPNDEDDTGHTELDEAQAAVFKAHLARASEKDAAG